MQNLFFISSRNGGRNLSSEFCWKTKDMFFWTFRINLSTVYILRLVAARLSWARLSCVSTRRKAMWSVRSGQNYSAKCRLLFCFCKKCCRSLKPLHPCCCALQTTSHACPQNSVPEMKKKVRDGRSHFKEFFFVACYVYI